MKYWQRQREHALRLHRQGVPTNEISKRLGLPEKTVTGMLLKLVEAPATSRKAVRCPGCGGMVRLPCLACQIREASGGD